MTSFIPLFPLNIVVYPGEKLNLHIFEPRYKQLVKECLDLKKPFGVPSVVGGKLKDYGTTVEIISIENEYPNGDLDIKTVGMHVFTVLEIVEQVPDKLYKGAIVHFPSNESRGVRSKMNKIVQELKHFHQLLEVKKEYSKPDTELSTYDIAHHIGMSVEQEYEMLLLLREDQRQEYIQRHLKTIVPTILELQQLKERIQLNGHFKKLSIEEK